MEHSERLNDIIGRIIAAKDASTIQQAYKEWAKTYDNDLAGFGYVAPQTGAALFDAALNMPDGLVFDAGCGTGLVGQALAERGYRWIEGADFSADMLTQATQSNYYTKLAQLDFRCPLPFPNSTYDGIICIGVYRSYIGDIFLGELIRILKPNGIITISSRFEYFDSDLLLQAQTHEQSGAITIQSITRQPYITGQSVDAAYLVLKKSGAFGE